MVTIRTNTGLDAALNAGSLFYHQKLDALTERLARRKIYRATFHELSVLTDRDLRDLGIPRSGIKRLAMEAAYDC